jgi:uncharacterized integral membrane protein (TIGR00698 family)
MGIVLMGARIAFEAVVRAGPKILGLVLLTVAFTVLVVEVLARSLFGLPEEIGSLMAAGASICGVSAVVATAGGIQADEDQIAYAVATILLFDALTLFTFPVVGRLLNLPDLVFGVWVGVSMFSTGPVAAAGFAYSDVAAQWATLTKLARNLLISVVVIGYAAYYARRRVDATVGSRWRLLWEKFPKFVVGFVGVMVIANLGLLSDAQITALENGYRWLFLFAFAGLGTSIRVSDMHETGIKPVLLLLATLLLVSSVAFAVVTTVFPASG